MKMNSFGKTILGVSITLFIFYIIFQKVSLQDLISVLENVNPCYLTLSLFPLIISLYFIAKRWQTLLSAMGYTISLTKCFFVIMASFPLISITPSKTGDFVRAYYLKDEIPMTKTIGSVLTEKIFDVITLIVFSLVGMVYYKIYDFLWLLIIFFIFLLMAIVVIKKGRGLHISALWHDRIQNVAFSMRCLSENNNLFIRTTAYSLAIWLLAILQVLIFFYALHIDVDILYLFAMLPLAIFIGMLPVSIGGMGTRDAAIIFLFSDYGTASELLAVGILFSLFRYWLLSISGLPFMRKMSL